MQSLIDPLVTGLDPETQAVIDEVCTALEWFDVDVPGSHEPAQARRFGRKWWLALRNTADHVCRQRIIDCCNAIVWADDEVIRTVQGHFFTRDQIREYGGRQSYVIDSETGEQWRLLEWPTGIYASGNPSYERPEGRAA